MRISKLILTILVIVTFSSCSTREDGGQMIGIVKSSISDQEELGLFYFSRIQYYGEHLPYHFHHKLIDDAKWLQKMVDSACTEVYSMSDSEIEKGEGRKCVLKIRTKILKGDSTDSLSAGLESEFHQIAKRQTNQNDSLERLILKSECLRIRNGIFKGLASANGSMCDFGFGFKGLAPTQFDTIQLDAATTYHLTTTLLNESVSPSEDITVEVQDEGVDHQFFYTVEGGLDMIIEYDDTDANGNPVGIHNIVTTGVGGEGVFTVILKHQPGIKDGNITTGDTDVEVDFETKVN